MPLSPPQLLLLGLCIISMAISGPTIRFAHAPALAIVLWRVVLAWPVLLGAALLRHERWPLRQGLLAGLCLALHWVTWVMAVQRTSIASASLLICTGSLWATLLSRPLLGEPVSRRMWAGLALALLGVGLVIAAHQGTGHSLSGDALALVGSVAWTAYTFVGRRARQSAGFWGYAATVYLVASLAVLAAVLLGQIPLLGLDGQTWLAVATLALFPTLLGHGTFNYLLRFVGPARLGLWSLSEPVIATLVAWPLFGEVPATQALLGGGLTLVGVGLGVRETASARPEA